MIDARGIEEIIATYNKHGWILRRVLLTGGLNKKLGDDKDKLFGDVTVFDAKTDAAWFSRPPKTGSAPWEIRYLGDIPYALLENVDENDAGFEDMLRGIELRLHESIAKKETA